MSLKRIINSIKEAFIVSGYSRTAIALLQLSDRQLEDLGISKELLKRGYAAYPWRVEEESQATPDNVSKFSDVKNAKIASNESPIMPQTPKAA